MKIKYFFIILGICLFFIVSMQSYHVIRNRGNVIFHLINQSLQDSSIIEIYIDGEKILEEIIVNGEFYTTYSIKVKPTSHSLVIRVDNKDEYQTKFCSLFVNWIIVDYYGERFSYRGDYDPFYVYIRKLPIWFFR